MNTFMMTELHLDRKSLALAGGAFSVCMGLVFSAGRLCREPQYLRVSDDGFRLSQQCR